jgi:hypothetical protein
MNESPDQPRNSGDSTWRFLWLPFAFVPSVVGFASLSMGPAPPWRAGALVILLAGCSVAAGFGLVGGVKNKGLKILLGLLLTAFFLVLNVAIMVYAGCSKSGGI